MNIFTGIEGSTNRQQDVIKSIEMVWAHARSPMTISLGVTWCKLKALKGQEGNDKKKVD